MKLIIIILLATNVYCQTPYKVPDKNDPDPVSYLERVIVTDVFRPLNEVERKELVRLFVTLYIRSVRQGRNDQIPPKVAIYELLKTNFPALANREAEGGISLASITGYCYSLPEYKVMIDKILREQKYEKCRE